MKMKRTNRTFSQVLAKVSEPNMQILMRKAITANRLAKSASTMGSKRLAYLVKVHALSGLKQNFPEQVKVERDWRHGSGIVLVEIARRGFGLHAPAGNFGLEL